ncbi:MAG: holo-ACP synthase [Pyrinomonadaceae bacterium]
MIVSIGIDIIEVERIREVVARTPRFVDRVFTMRERDYCAGRGPMVSAQRYAARFAAKEAAFKAFGTGWSGGVGWQEVEIVRQESGAPALIFHGKAQQLFERSGAKRVHLSMSHTAHHAVAQVILEQ